MALTLLRAANSYKTWRDRAAYQTWIISWVMYEYVSQVTYVLTQDVLITDRERLLLGQYKRELPQLWRDFIYSIAERTAINWLCA
jgi:hypothetical protein